MLQYLLMTSPENGDPVPFRVIRAVDRVHALRLARQQVTDLDSDLALRLTDGTSTWCGSVEGLHDPRVTDHQWLGALAVEAAALAVQG